MAEFTAPGPGNWELDRSHYPGATTPISQSVAERSMLAGMKRVMAEIGAPADGIQAKFVHGFMYTRLRPLVGADKPPRRPPPAPILKIAARLHPEFRRRARAARRTLDASPAPDVARRWQRELEPALRATNLRFQAVDPAGSSDADLQDHISDLLDHLHEQFELHFWLHGHDLGPVSRYLYHCIQWGLDPADALDALAGASPSTSEPVERLVAIREAVEAAGGSCDSLETVRASSEDAARLLDDYIRDHGHRLVTGYDLTALTLNELPGVLLDSIRTARTPTPVDHAAIAAALRERVEPAEREHFDAVLADARAVMDMRDNNGPVTVEWPAGLLRRALLAAGTRLAAAGALDDPEHALEVSEEEARTLVVGPRPSASELSARRSARLEAGRLEPPSALGPPEPAPPLDVLPEPLPEIVHMIQTSLEYLGMTTPSGATPDPLRGAGIGSAAYVGRARAAASPEEAIETMEPGDVLVVRATSPAFNAVLAIAGAVVTADGGPLSHAAVLARELGIAGVVGAPGALDIPDGARVEVDPVAGRVRIVE